MQAATIFNEPESARPSIEALGRALCALQAPVHAVPVSAPVVRTVRPRVHLRPLKREIPRWKPPKTLEEVTPPEPLSTLWEPEGVTDRDIREAEDEVLEITPETLDGSQVRALYLEVIRRAVHDWVLYKNSRRMMNRELARDAYVWLFEEDESHPWWLQRKRTGKEITSLAAICEIIDVDIERVRQGARDMTEKKIMTAGRPPERRKKLTEDNSYYDEHAVCATFSLPAEEE